MDFRNKALELYKKGKSIEEIQKVVGLPIEISTLEKWDRENKKFSSTKELIKKTLKLRKRLKEKDKLTDSQKVALNEQLRDTANAILEIDSENTIAQKDLFNSLYNLNEWNEAESLGKQILENEPANIVILNKLANIATRKKEYNTAIEYLEKITLINPGNQNFKKKLEEIKQMVKTIETVNTNLRILFKKSKAKSNK